MQFDIQNAATSLHPQVAAAILGAVIAGLFAFVVGWLAHRRERKRNDIQWHQEKLLEAYSNCIYYLVKLSISSLKNQRMIKMYGSISAKHNAT